MSFNTVYLKAIGISKDYNSSIALADIDFSLCGGEIHSVLGSKGAGKSTMMRILSGALPVDKGYFEIFGKQHRRFTPVMAREIGMQSLYESQYLMQDLTVAENIFMGEYIANSVGFVNYRKLREKAEDILKRLNVPMDPDTLPVNLGEFEKQVVQLARVYANNARIVLADNIASSFTNGQKQKMVEILKEMSASGIGIVYFTHMLEDAIRISDRITVLRDGKRVCVEERKSFDTQVLIREMVGYDESMSVCLNLTREDEDKTTFLKLACAAENNKNILEYLKAAISFINGHLDDSISPKDVADAVHLSSGYLMMLFKNHMDTSIMEFIYKQRIEKSKSMLAEKGKKISEVASDVGIPNSQYFSVLFKKYTDMTPKEYRKTQGV
jgi:ABC-type sugar transport system ATPase subunit